MKKIYQLYVLAKYWRLKHVTIMFYMHTTTHTLTHTYTDTYAHTHIGVHIPSSTYILRAKYSFTTKYTYKYGVINTRWYARTQHTYVRGNLKNKETRSPNSLTSPFHYRITSTTPSSITAAATIEKNTYNKPHHMTNAFFSICCLFFRVFSHFWYLSASITLTPLPLGLSRN